MWANVGPLHRESMFISFDEEVPPATEKRHVTPDGLAPLLFFKMHLYYCHQLEHITTEWITKREAVLLGREAV